jgi:hypothetical protein
MYVVKAALTFVKVLFTSSPGIPVMIGVAEPIVVPGAIQIWLEASAMNAPALKA